jgi:PKD repeat protein
MLLVPVVHNAAAATETTPTTGPTTDSPLGVGAAVHIKGGQFVNSSGTPVRLLGVDAVGTQQTCIGTNPVVGATFDVTEAAAIRTWHADAVRVPLNEDCWLGINGAPRGMTAAAYRAQIEQWVSALNADGIVAILDLHWSAPGTYLSDRQWLTPDADHSPTFWTQVATTFAHTPGVIFDLFNEPALHDPHPTAPDWVCWLDGCNLTIAMPTAAGGPEPTSGPQVTYQAVGYQQLVATVRATGADQPILISGLNFGNDPCDAWLHGLIGENGTCTGLEPEPNDPEHQLAMSFHAYSWDRCVTVGCWAPIASLAARRDLPLVITEFGEDDCSDGYANTLMTWSDEHDVSYLAYGWLVGSASSCTLGTSDIGADLSLLSSWDGTPSTVSGEAAAIRSHLFNELEVAVPVATFTSAQSAGSLTATFTDASTVASPTTITEWSWNFGDGSPLSSAEDPSHTYSSPGTFTVTLTVTDNTGQTSTITHQIVVAPVHASFTYPTAGQTNVSTLTPFSWADIPAGQGYQLWIGTSRGDGSLLKSGLLSATTSSYKAPALPTGVTLWARLYTEVAGDWGNDQDITFTVTGNRADRPEVSARQYGSRHAVALIDQTRGAP